MKIVLFDLDLTLLDSNYQLTSEKFQEKCRAIGDTIVLGLNSDTPMSRLQEWAKQLEIPDYRSAPLVAENGAITRLGSQDSYLVEAEIFTTIRKQASRILPQHLKRELTVQLADPMKVLNGTTRLPPGRHLLLDTERECSLACWFLYISQCNQIQTDPEAMLLAKKPLKLLPGKPLYTDLSWDFDWNSAIAIARKPDTKKHMAAAKVVEHFGDAHSYYMVGNSVHDLLNPSPFIHCAVANATANYRRCAAFISQSKYTLGSVEALDWVLRQ